MIHQFFINLKTRLEQSLEMTVINYYNNYFILLIWRRNRVTFVSLLLWSYSLIHNIILS